MLRIRGIACRVLPLLVVVWMAFTVFGGAMYVAKHAKPSEHSVAKAGMGLCAATAAILFSAGVGKTPPSLPDIRYSPLDMLLSRTSQVTLQGASAPLVIPLVPLLQVFRR